MKLSDRNEQARTWKKAGPDKILYEFITISIFSSFLLKTCTKTETCRFSTGTERKTGRKSGASQWFTQGSHSCSSQSSQRVCFIPRRREYYLYRDLIYPKLRTRGNDATMVFICGSRDWNHKPPGYRTTAESVGTLSAPQTAKIKGILSKHYICCFGIRLHKQKWSCCMMWPSCESCSSCFVHFLWRSAQTGSIRICQKRIRNDWGRCSTRKASPNTA